MRILHVIPILNHDAPSDLLAAQEIAIASILQALDFSDVAASVVGACFPDEATSIDRFPVRPTLLRSAKELVPEGVDRRLPLLQEVLGALGDASTFDIAIFTNADICVQPQFYRAVSALVRSGVDAGSITRRTVTSRHDSSDELTWASMEVGAAHAGHDCIFFDSTLLEAIDVGEVTLGAGNVMRPLLASLHVSAHNFMVLHDLHLTFHIDDAQDWQDSDYVPNSLHNSQETIEVLMRLNQKFGEVRVTDFLRLEGFDPHPDSRIEPDLARQIRNANAERSSRLTFGTRLNLATQSWPTLNRRLNNAAAVFKRIRA